MEVNMAKSHRRFAGIVSWAIFYVTVLSGKSAGDETKVWLLTTSCTGSKRMSAEVIAPYFLQCASTCSKSAECARFCFSRTSGRCYIKNDQTSEIILAEAGERLTNIITCSNEPCPTDLGYTVLGGECIKVYTHILTYEEARERCEQDGAHLYHFRTRHSDSLLVAEAASAAGITFSPGARLWMGADDLEEEGKFVWSDGCRLASDSYLWYAGSNEPSNDATNGENCVELYADVMYLNDIQCSFLRSFICQIS